MKGKINGLKIISLIAVLTLFGFNLYQGAKVKEYKDALTMEVHQNLQKFASTSGSDYSDSLIYVEAYAAIESAFNAFVIVSEVKGYTDEEYNKSLPKLLLTLKTLMLNDKGKVVAAFKDTDGGRLIFKISDDFNDKESISKMLELLK